MRYAVGERVEVVDDDGRRVKKGTVVNPSIVEETVGYIAVHLDGLPDPGRWRPYHVRPLTLTEKLSECAP